MSLRPQTFAFSKSMYFLPLEEPTARIDILEESGDFLPFEPTTGVIPVDKDIPEGIFREAAEHINLHAVFQRSNKSTVREVLLGSTHILEPHHMSDLIVKQMAGFYENLLAIKESEIRKLRNELSEFKKERHQLNSELEQIKNECKQGILGIPEVQQALCEYNQREILFIFVLNDMTRDLSDRLDEVEYGLTKKYTDWIIGFEYVEDRISSEQFENSQVEIFERD